MEDPVIRGFKQVTDIQDMETQASPSLLNVRQSDLKIIIDDFPEDQMKPASSTKVQEYIQYISKMIEKIKNLAKKKKVPGNISEYNTCHSCRGILERSLLVCCSQRDCLRYFCFRCLNKKFNQTPKNIYEITILPAWNCVSCQGLCNCKICKDRFFGQSQEFPAQLTRFEKSKKKQLDIPLKVENDDNSDFHGIKKEFVEDMSSLQMASVVSPLISFMDEKKAMAEFMKMQDNNSTNIHPFFSLTKPRSKALAKRLRIQKVTNPLDDDDSSNEDTESLHSLRKSAVSEETKRQQSTKSQTARGNKSRAKEECHMCQKMISEASLASCSIDQCKKHYCIDCIREHYQRDFDLLDNYNPEYWVCYSCGGTCECAKCKRRRTAGRKSKDIQVREETLNVPLNRNKSQKLEKRRMKFYDTLSEEEEEEELQQQLAGEVESFQISVEDDRETLDEQRKHVKVEKEQRIDPIMALKQEITEKIEHNEIIKVEKDTSEIMIVENDVEQEKVVEKIEPGIESHLKEESNNKCLLKKKRFRKPALIDKEDIDDSKIISEVSIDQAFITLYDAENEEELKKEVQMKFDH